MVQTRTSRIQNVFGSQRRNPERRSRIQNAFAAPSESSSEANLSSAGSTSDDSTTDDENVSNNCFGSWFKTRSCNFWLLLTCVGGALVIIVWGGIKICSSTNGKPFGPSGKPRGRGDKYYTAEGVNSTSPEGTRLTYSRDAVDYYSEDKLYRNHGLQKQQSSCLSCLHSTYLTLLIIRLIIGLLFIVLVIFSKLCCC